MVMRRFAINLGSYIEIRAAMVPPKARVATLTTKRKRLILKRTFYLGGRVTRLVKEEDFHFRYKMLPPPRDGMIELRKRP